MISAADLQRQQHPCDSSYDRYRHWGTAGRRHRRAGLCSVKPGRLTMYLRDPHHLR
jgi:hypothetical protein